MVDILGEMGWGDDEDIHDAIKQNESELKKK